MFLTYVSEFVEFLSVKDQTLEDTLAHMVLRVLTPIDATAAFITQLNSENGIEYVASFGIGLQTQRRYASNYEMRDKHPVTDSIRNRSVVWINTLPQWPAVYSNFDDLSHESGDRTFICFPIEKCGTPIAVLGIFSKSVIHPDAEVDSFLRAIGNVLSLHVYRKIDSAPESRNKNSKRTIESRGEVNTKLTERQRLIWRLMSEERTNIGIGELLGYSESTIRQETIKIFAILNCHGREEASGMYRKQLVEPRTS